jgi:hypothetical protein
MTLASTDPTEIKLGNDSTTVFSFTFKINKAADIQVTHSVAVGDGTFTDTVLTEGTGTSNYSLSVSAYPGTGSITYPASLGTELATGNKLTLARIVVLEQQTDLKNQGAYKAQTVEDAFDLSRMIDLQQQDELDRSLKVPISDNSGADFTVPSPGALKLWRWDSAGTALELVSLSDLSLGLGTATKWAFDSSTSMADPGTGDIRFNNATLASVTQLAVSGLSSQSTNPDISDWVASWDDSNSAVRGYLYIHEDGSPQNFLVVYINGAITDNTTWLQIPCTYIDSGGSFTAADSLVVGFSATGDAVSQGISMLWDSDTSDADSGAGKIYFNNATLSSVTVVYVDDVDVNSVSINSFVDTWDDVASSNKGTITVKKKTDSSVYAQFKVSGAVTSASTYSKVAVTHQFSNGTFTDADPVDVVFTPAGIRGSDSGYDYLWDNTTTDDDPGAGSIGWNHATIASATEVMINDAENGGTDIQADIDTWDDPTSTIKGQLIITDQADQTIFVKFNITGAVTSNAGYSTIGVAHSTSQGTFTNDTLVTVQHIQNGDKGDTGATGATGLTGPAGSDGGFTALSTTDSITAGTTQTQAGATALTTNLNRVTTSTAGDGVKLPTAAAGIICHVINDTANSIEVYPNTSDTLEGGSVNVSDSLEANSFALYESIDDTDWFKVAGGGGPIDVADLAVGTDGELITWDASGNPAVVAVGTAGQVLTSGGVGVAPTFAGGSSTGTFTPGITFGGAAVGLTYSQQDGLYTDLGNGLVHVTMTIVLSAVGSSTGTANITGLPFTANATYYFIGNAFRVQGFSALSNNVLFRPVISTTVGELYNSDGATRTVFTNSHFTSSSNLQITVLYKKA